MRHLYSALLYCLLPLAVVRLLWRSRRDTAYRRRLGERLGYYRRPRPAKPVVLWVHAVSVGELAASAPLVERMLSAFPSAAVVLTTSTPTGSRRVRALFGERVTHVYCPWDLPGPVARFLRWARPDLLVLVETELWPNILHQCAARGCRTVLVNGRLSQRSAERYARVAPLSRWLVGKLDAVVCCGAADSERFLQLGVPGSRLSVSGNLKWDVTLQASVRARGEQLQRLFGEQQALIAASTHPGEEQRVLTAWRAVAKALPGCRLVMVPRHPERGAEVTALCVARGFRVATLADEPPPGDDWDILLCATVGELAPLYALATVAFVGGSLVAVGGHNPLEAAMWGVPVVSGAQIRNFEDVYGALAEAGACALVSDESGLAAVALNLLQDPAQRARMAQAAAGVIEANRGALERTLAVVSSQVPPR